MTQEPDLLDDDMGDEPDPVDSPGVSPVLSDVKEPFTETDIEWVSGLLAKGRCWYPCLHCKADLHDFSAYAVHLSFTHPLELGWKTAWTGFPQVLPIDNTRVPTKPRRRVPCHDDTELNKKRDLMD